MSANNNNNSNNNQQPRNNVGNTGMMNPNFPPNFNPASSQSQGQNPQLGFGLNHFQLAQAQALALAQAQSKAQLLQQSPSMSSGGKRVPLKPPVRPVGPMGNRKNQKPQETALSGKVAKILPESALYTQLREFECRVDSALMRKKADIQEALKNPSCVQKTLRVYVFNTFDNQRAKSDPPTWTLKVLGQILDDRVDNSTTYPKFSSFFKRVTITLDKQLYPENHTILWENCRSAAPVEGFEVKRKGDKEFVVNIKFEMNYTPEKFKLSPALTELLGTEAENRPRIIAAIWHYVKARKLQNPNDPSYFNCDAQLQKVFGEEKMKFTMVSQKISQHLSLPPPVEIQHQIKLSGSNPAGNACYDILVDIPLPIQRELSMLLSSTEKGKEIEVSDEGIRVALRKIHEHRKRRAFFLGFSQSPVEFINALIESQSRDLKHVSGEASRTAEVERHSEFFNQPWVEDAVIRYLTRKPAGGQDAPGST